MKLMIHASLITAAISASFFTGAALAQTPKINCKTPMTQADMNHCSYQDFLKEDVVLNQLYQQLMKRESPEHKKGLLKSQLAWLKFRDAECTYRTQKYKGGSIRPLMYNTCLESLTKERNSHFRNALKDNY